MTGPVSLALAAFLPLMPQEDLSKEQLLERLDKMEREMAELRGLVEQESAEREHLTETMLEELDTVEAAVGSASQNQGFILGGYGEHHFNIGEGRGNDVSDIHRFVLYAGYRFSEEISLHSETEIEHAFVDSDDGELVIEQLYAEIALNDGHSIRMGRVLAPLGIINERHEPTTFNGVERPSVAKYIIPSTWSVDGAGFAGRFGEAVRYQAYVVGGLNGAGFDSDGGLRGGRLKERPSLNELAFTGRLDWFPAQECEFEFARDLRTGVGVFHGGVDNGDQGKDPGIDGEVTLVAVDAETSFDRIDLRGVYAMSYLDDARKLNEQLRDPVTLMDPGIAENTHGWYLETGVHVLADSFKTGRFEDSDLICFVRYEDFDTQYNRPGNATRDPAAEREEWTVGLTWFLTPQFVLKLDYQFLDDKTDERDDLFNLGFGYQF